MANRYLRGTGARNWNDTANWSDVSGGAGGASVPTSADNVIFDANSGTGTITVNAIVNMLDFTCTNIGALTLANAAYAFNVFGSLTLHTNLTVTFTSTGYLYMKATDSRTITTNGKVANWNRLYFDGVGGTWTLQDEMNIGNTRIDPVNGTWITNNQTVSAASIYGQLGNSIINFGSSIINLTIGVRLTLFTTIVPGTSTINVTSDWFEGADKTFYDINLINVGAMGGTISGFTCRNLTRTSGSSVVANMPIGDQITVTSTLTLTGNNSTNNRLLIFSNTIGTPRTITCNGTVIASNVDFRDIVLAGTCNKDLSAITGGSGDCGGNSGIIFTTAQAQYFKNVGLEKITAQADREFSSDTGWWLKESGIAITGGVAAFTSTPNSNKLYKALLTLGKVYTITFTVSGRTAGGVRVEAGTGAVSTYKSADGTYTEVLTCTSNTDLNFRCSGITTLNIDNVSVRQLDLCEVSDAANWFADEALTVSGRVPLPQDLGSKFLATSFDRTCTVSCNVPRIPCLDMSEVVNSVTWSLANALEVYGSYVLGNNITQSGNFVLTLMGRGNYNINTFSKLVYDLTINAINGVYTHNSNLTLTLYHRVLNGSVYLNVITLTAKSLIATGGKTYLNNGVIILNEVNPASSFPIYITSQSYIDAGQSNIILLPQSGSGNLQFSSIGCAFNKLQFGGSHTGNFDISGNNTIAELIIDSGRKVRFTAGTTQTIAKASIGAGATISSVTAATHTLNYTGSDVVEADGGITVTNSIATPDEKWFTGAGSTDGGGNSGWIFGTIDDAFTPKIMWFD